MKTNEIILQVLRAQRISEKGARLQEVSNQYVFEVAPTATKPQIKAAVENLLDVKVERINVLNVNGKARGFRFRKGRRSGWRKAYVKLAEGQNIEILSKP